MGKRHKSEPTPPPATGDFAEHEFDEIKDEAGGASGDEFGSAVSVAAKVTRTESKADGGATDEPKKPKFGTARPAGKGAVPRVCDQLERVGESADVTRYKIACRNYAPQKTRYIIAECEDDAVELYLATNGLDKLVAKLKKQAGKDDEVEQPDLVVTELPD